MKCFFCNEESFQFCSLCQKYLCAQHKCLHLGDFEDSFREDFKNIQEEFLEQQEFLQKEEILKEGQENEPNKFEKTFSGGGELQQERISGIHGVSYENSTERRHWLSYGTIISSMPETKLREAISRYKYLIKELEQELLLRSYHNSTSSYKASKAFTQNSNVSYRSQQSLPAKTHAFLRKAQKQGLLQKVIEFLQQKS